MTEQLAEALASMTADWCIKMSSLVEDLHQMRKTYPEVAHGLNVIVEIAMDDHTLIDVVACSKDYAKTVEGRLNELVTH